MLPCDLCFHWNAWISCLDDVSYFTHSHSYLMMFRILLDDVIYLVGVSITYWISMLDFFVLTMLLHFSSDAFIR